MPALLLVIRTALPHSLVPGRWGSGLLLLLCLAACGEGGPQVKEPPPIPPEQFARLLDEIYTLESAFVLAQPTDTLADSLGWRHYHGLLQQQGISVEAYREAHRYYLKHPDLLKPVVDSLVKHTEQQQFEQDHPPQQAPQLDMPERP